MALTTRHTRTIGFGAAVIFGSLLLSTTAGLAQAPEGGVPLGTAAPFVILAATGITNAGATTLLGDVGSHPNGAFTGTTSVSHTGTNHGNSEVTRIAKDDLVTAYDTAAGAATTETISADLGGRSLVAGVYTAPSTMSLTGTVTLVGDADDVFIFQAGSSLITGTDSQVALDGVSPCNVYWQVGSSATIGTRTAFAGNILALTSATLDTGATVNGRVLARNGTVTLLNNTLDASACTTVVDDPTDDDGTDDGTDGSDDGTDSSDDGTDSTDDGTDSTDGTDDGTDGTDGTDEGTDGTEDAGTDDGADDGTDGPTSTTGTTDTTDGDETTSQVTDVPEGGVSAGDGSAGGNPASGAPLLVLALLASIAALAAASTRPRRMA